MAEYQNTINKANQEIKDMGDSFDSDKYEAEVQKIREAEKNIISLTGSIMDLKKEIFGVRWKGFNDLETKMQEVNSDLEHLSGLIDDNEMYIGKWGTALSDYGYAKLALIGKELANDEDQIANFR